MHDGFHENLDWVLSGQEMDEFHGLLHSSDSDLLFTVLSMMADHDHGSETFNNWALNLLEPTLLVAASCVGHEDLLSHSLDLQVSTKRNVWALIDIVGPLSEQLGLESVFWSVFTAVPVRT